jgi:NADH-quinone oxidoreductase subunit A
MSPASLSDYIPVLLTFAVMGLIAALIFSIGLIFGPQRPTPQKLAPFESGQELITTPRSRFSVKFYLVAIFFIAFDVEAVFLYPWAVIYLDGVVDKALLFAEMLFFLLVLGLGLTYVWKKGALEWD